MIDIASILDGDFGHFVEEDGLGCGEGKVVLADGEVDRGDCDELVFVENVHFKMRFDN